jgi:hypothetical protein
MAFVISKLKLSDILASVRNGVSFNFSISGINISELDAGHFLPIRPHPTRPVLTRPDPPEFKKSRHDPTHLLNSRIYITVFQSVQNFAICEKVNKNIQIS